VSTFLGAHVVPPEHRDDRQTYLASLRERTLPEIAERGLAEFCDVFVEDAAYTIDEARRVFEAASSLGLRPKLHADQLGNGGGAALAAEVAAVSADHLEHASDEGLARMAQANVVGVALPFASLYTFQPPLDARRLVEAGVAVAVSTDFNPGTAPSYHLPMALHLACTLNRLTPAQALKGATVYAARALGREGRIGSLEPGKAPDFALFDAPDVNHWLYRVREGTCRLTVKAGRAVHGRPEPWRAE
jgi:imidazolonepropionase